MNLILGLLDLEWWGNVTGVIGFFITIGGFVWTIKSANAAKAAAEATRRELAKFDAVAALANAKAAIDESKRLHRIEAWDVALERYSTARSLIVSVRSAPLLLDDASQRKLSSVVSHLSAVEESVEARRLAPPEEQMQTERLNRALAAASDLIVEVQACLRA